MAGPAIIPNYGEFDPIRWAIQVFWRSGDGEGELHPDGGHEVWTGARPRYPGLLHHVRGGAHHQHRLPRADDAGEDLGDEDDSDGDDGDAGEDPAQGPQQDDAASDPPLSCRSHGEQIGHFQYVQVQVQVLRGHFFTWKG